MPPAIAFTPLTNGTVTSTRTVPNIIIIDGGSGVNTTSGTRPRLYYKKSTEANQYVGNTSTDNGWKWVEASNTSSPFTFVINYSLLTSALSTGDVIQYFFVAQDLASTPNVAVGGAVLTTQPTSVALTNANFPATPVYSYTIAQGVSGTITVGPNESITSLTNTGGVFDYINNRVVTGNVTVLVTGNLTSETGTVALNAFAEEGAGAGTYTITIRPASGTSPTISGTNSSGGLLRFNSAQRVIIDGRRPGESSGNNLTIVNNATSGSIAAIHFMGQSAYNPSLTGCAYDTVRFCTIKTGSNSNSSAYGIFIGGTSVGSAGYGNRAIVLSDNQVTATYYGVRVIGTSGFPSDSITIARNTIGGSGSSYGSSDTVRYRGIMASWVTNLSITDNAILNISPATSSGAAIFVDNSSGATIARNVIDGVLGYSSSGSNVYGIGLSTGVANTTILGNRINRIFYTAGGNWWAYGIDVNTSGGNANVLLANNMISNVAHDYGSSTTWSTYGIRITSTGNVKVYHNSVFLRGSYFVPSSGAGQSAALLINTSTANIDVRNNIFHNRMYGASGSKSYAIYIATNPSTIPIAALDYNNYDVSGTAQGVACICEWCRCNVASRAPCSDRARSKFADRLGALCRYHTYCRCAPCPAVSDPSRHKCGQLLGLNGFRRRNAYSLYDGRRRSENQRHHHNPTAEYGPLRWRHAHTFGCGIGTVQRRYQRPSDADPELSMVPKWQFDCWCNQCGVRCAQRNVFQCRQLLCPRLCQPD